MQIVGIKKCTKGRKLNPTAMHIKAQINRINTSRYNMLIPIKLNQYKK